MIAVIQRVRRAEVRRASGESLGVIELGMAVLLCAETGDSAEDAQWMIRRLAAIRIFDDTDGRMNLDLRQAGGAILIVSQFTLAADTSRGNRPSFLRAAPPVEAVPLIDRVISGMRDLGFDTQCGEFGAAMEVELVNDGPVTITLQSRPGNATHAPH